MKSSKAYLRIKFGVNPIHILGVMKKYMHKAKLNFCHAYRLNRLEEQIENRYIATPVGSTSEGCLLVVRNESSSKPKKYPTLVESHHRF